MNSLPDFQDRDGQWVASARYNGRSLRTKAKIVWDGMKERATPGKGRQLRSEAYAGVSIAPEFLNFQFFADWYVKQIGYGLGYHLDKDLLHPGNKVYSPEACVLVPIIVNTFCTDRSGTNKSGLPPGASYDAKRRKYCVQIQSRIAKKIFVGLFDTVEEARNAYNKRKAQAARDLAEKLLHPPHQVDPRVIAALRNFTVEKYRNQGEL